MPGRIDEVQIVQSTVGCRVRQANRLALDGNAPFAFDFHRVQDLILEVAVAGRCDAIITYNKRHFKNVGKFGLRVLDPREFLSEIGVIS